MIKFSLKKNLTYLFQLDCETSFYNIESASWNQPILYHMKNHGCDPM